jgi:hypothetical protein
MNLQAYMANVHNALNRHRNWRYGQALFNVLFDMYPNSANKVRGTNADPFYAKNTKSPQVGEFMDFLFEEAKRG